MPQSLVAFRKLCQATFQSQILNESVNSWPPAVPHDDAARSFLLFFIDQIRISRNPLLRVHWGRDNFVSPAWCKSPSSINRILHVICIARTSADIKANVDRLYWVIVDTAMHFEVHAIMPSGLRHVDCPARADRADVARARHQPPPDVRPLCPGRGRAD
jgi:hypothetical protein